MIVFGLIITLIILQLRNTLEFYYKSHLKEKQHEIVILQSELKKNEENLKFAYEKIGLEVKKLSEIKSYAQEIEQELKDKSNLIIDFKQKEEDLDKIKKGIFF